MGPSSIATMQGLTPIALTPIAISLNPICLFLFPYCGKSRQKFSMEWKTRGWLVAAGGAEGEGGGAFPRLGHVPGKVGFAVRGGAAAQEGEERQAQDRG